MYIICMIFFLYANSKVRDLLQTELIAIFPDLNILPAAIQYIEEILERC